MVNSCMECVEYVMYNCPGGMQTVLTYNGDRSTTNKRDVSTVVLFPVLNIFGMKTKSCEYEAS